MIITIAAFFYLRRQLIKGDYGHNAIRMMFLTIMIMLVLDIMLHYLENPSLVIIYQTIVVIITSLLPLVGYLWLLYVRYMTKIKVKPTIILIVATIFFVTNLVLTIMSVASNVELFFQFSQTTEGVLLIKAGYFYWLHALITILPFVLATILLLIRWKVLQKKRRPFIFLGISIFPILSILSQVMTIDFTISLTSIVVTFVIIVFDLQHQFVVTDYLTGLYNRRRLSQKLKEKIHKMKTNHSFGGYMIDVNNFKTINDQLGHALGDRVLQDIANILLSIADPSDLVSRYGGDEFVIIKNISNNEELRAFKHQIIDAVDTYNKVSGRKCQVELSIGAQLYTKSSDYSAATFLENIDERMYHNKAERKEFHKNDAN